MTVTSGGPLLTSASTWKPAQFFGREPAVWVGVLESALALSVAFGFFTLTTEHLGLMNAAVSALLALIIMPRTNDAWGSALIQLLKALLALGVAYGLSLTAEQTAAIIATVSVVLSILLRQQVSPVDKHGNLVKAPVLLKKKGGDAFIP